MIGSGRSDKLERNGYTHRTPHHQLPANGRQVTTTAVATTSSSRRLGQGITFTSDASTATLLPLLEDDSGLLDAPTKLIALRLHQLEVGQKKILQALSSMTNVLDSELGMSRKPLISSRPSPQPITTSGLVLRPGATSSTTWSSNSDHRSHPLMCARPQDSCISVVEEPERNDGERIVRIKLKSNEPTSQETLWVFCESVWHTCWKNVSF